MKQKSGKEKTGPSPAAIPIEEQARPWWAWLDAAPVFWLVVVISAYGLLALHPMAPTRNEVPGVVEADRLALPLLVVTVIAGIVRRTRLNAAPVLWLVMVITAYGLLVFHPMAPTHREVPGLVAADRLALPLLVVTMIAGIIRYACAGAAEPRSGVAPAELRAERRGTE